MRLMAQRDGPQLRSLIYDRVLETDHVMRPEAADTIKARSVIAPLKGRIDSRIQCRQAPEEHLAAGGVH